MSVVGIGRSIARNRERQPARAIVALCKRYLSAYNNYSYDVVHNGEQRVLNLLAATGPRVVFDVGATEGNWARIARAQLSAAQLHCFEIAPPTFAKLERAVHGLPGTHLNPVGLSDFTGECTLRVYPDDSTLSTTVTTYDDSRQSVEITARVVRGDEYVRERGIELIDLLKIDAEDAEWAILHGLTAWSTS